MLSELIPSGDTPMSGLASRRTRPQKRGPRAPDIVGSGKIKAGQAGKRHGMIKRTNDQIRKLRGTTVLKDCDAKRIKKSWMPNG